MNKTSIVIGILVGAFVAGLVSFLVLREPVEAPASEGRQEEMPAQSTPAPIRIKVAGIFVDDQQKALQFYTETLGFVKKTDKPLGEFSWLTVAAPDAPEGMELLLEPNVHQAASDFQRAIYSDGIPATALYVDDVSRHFERLKGLGVDFPVEPTKMGTVTVAVLDDTCGNLIQLVEE